MAVTHDYIVVGSGMTGAHAAQTLVEAGCNVLMLDVGFRDTSYSGVVPDDDFLSIRMKDEAQHRYFLGNDFEGIPWGKISHSLTPPRQFIIKDADKWLPFKSQTFNLIESLSYGGRGSGWGAGCAKYPSWELKKMGLIPEEINKAYEVIAGRIGVAACDDDASPYCSGGLRTRLPVMRMDKSIGYLYQAYLKQRRQMNASGFYMGKNPIAVLTEDWPERKSTKYKDMEFWTDHDSSVYRPWMTVDMLKTKSNFTFYGNCLVLKFKDEETRVCVNVRRIDNNQLDSFYCKKLVLACGAMSTARIVLRSGPSGARVPVLTNPNSLVLCLNWRMLGDILEPLRTSLGQLEMFFDENNNHEDVRMVSFFTYRSLLLFKLIKEMPFNMADSLKMIRALHSSFVIATVNHPDHQSLEKYIELDKNDESRTGDRLRIVYHLSEDEKVNIERNERKIMNAFRRLGIFPLKKQQLEHGSTMHYAGTLPFSNKQHLNTLSPEGRLNGTRNVYVADSSGFLYLPANGLTFTSMANAHLVAKRLISE
jgi:hypothetical protein